MAAARISDFSASHLSRRKSFAGILVFFVLGIGAVVLLSPTRLFVPKYNLQMYLADPGGLVVGNPVKMDGLPIGEVTSIELTHRETDPNRRIRVQLKVAKEYRDLIRQDSTATIKSIGLLNGIYVAIDRGFQGASIPPNGEIRANPAQVTNAVDVIKAIGAVAEVVSQNNKRHKNNQPPASPASH